VQGGVVVRRRRKSGARVGNAPIRPRHAAARGRRQRKRCLCFAMAERASSRTPSRPQSRAASPSPWQKQSQSEQQQSPAAIRRSTRSPSTGGWRGGAAEEAGAGGWKKEWSNVWHARRGEGVTLSVDLALQTDLLRGVGDDIQSLPAPTPSTPSSGWASSTKAREELAAIPRAR